MDSERGTASAGIDNVGSQVYFTGPFIVCSAGNKRASVTNQSASKRFKNVDPRMASQMAHFSLAKRKNVTPQNTEPSTIGSKLITPLCRFCLRPLQINSLFSVLRAWTQAYRLFAWRAGGPAFPLFHYKIGSFSSHYLPSTIIKYCIKACVSLFLPF